MQIVRNRCARVQVGLAKGADLYHISFDYGSTSALGTGALDELLTQWNTAIRPKLLDVLSSEMVLNYAYCYCHQPDTALTALLNYDGVVGALGVEALPTNVAIGIRLRQLDVSSKHNGCIKIPGCPESAVQGSQVFATFLTTNVAPLVAEMILQWVLSGNTWNPVVMQRFSGGAPITPVGNTVWTADCALSPYTVRKRTTERRDFHP